MSCRCPPLRIDRRDGFVNRIKEKYPDIQVVDVQYGGGDPVRWCERLAGRLPLLHMKDFAIGKDHQPVYAEIGSLVH